MRASYSLAATTDDEIGIRGEHDEADADVRAVALAITLGDQHDELEAQRPQVVHGARAGRESHISPSGR